MLTNVEHTASAKKTRGYYVGKVDRGSRRKFSEYSDVFTNPTSNTLAAALSTGMEHCEVAGTWTRKLVKGKWRCMCRTPRNVLQFIDFFYTNFIPIQ